jgi:adenosylcobinamide-phosphate synthase
VYDGVTEQRPALGTGPDACADDIVRAWRLVWRTTLLWVIAACAALFVLDGVLHA